MSTYEIISTALSISMLLVGLCFFIKCITPSFKESPSLDLRVDRDQYLMAKTHALMSFGLTARDLESSRINGVTYLCNTNTVILLKLKSERKCLGFIINDDPLYLDLSANCEIHLSKEDTFCLHTHIEIEYYKVFERVEKAL